MGLELPELPAPHVTGNLGKRLYTADQMREFARAAIEQHCAAGMEMPLPCDVALPAVTFRKGVALATLVKAAERWCRAAMEASPLKIDPDAIRGLRDSFIGESPQ